MEMTPRAATPTRGRRRDPEIASRILAAARRQLACRGYEGMSLAAIAEEASTTRQALYRRWPDKASLAAEAVAEDHERDAICLSNDPLALLTLELREFQRFISRPGQLSLAGTMLQDATAPASREEYRRRVVNPRIERLRAILEHARSLALIDAEADIEPALAAAVGGWYERELTGMRPMRSWAARTARLVWRGLGGH